VSRQAGSARYTLTVRSSGGRARPLAEHDALALEEAWELSAIYRALGYSPESIRIDPETDRRAA
jgi:hypothetical protein